MDLIQGENEGRGEERGEGKHNSPVLKLNAAATVVQSPVSEGGKPFCLERPNSSAPNTKLRPS